MLSNETIKTIRSCKVKRILTEQNCMTILKTKNLSVSLQAHRPADGGPG
jgi:hypothetical protein